MHHLMGWAELIQALGYSTAHAFKLRKEDPLFPDPVAVLSSGPVWESADVIAYRELRPKRGRWPKPDGGVTSP